MTATRKESRLRIQQLVEELGRIPNKDLEVLIQAGTEMDEGEIGDIISIDISIQLKAVAIEVEGRDHDAEEGDD